MTCNHVAEGCVGKDGILGMDAVGGFESAAGKAKDAYAAVDEAPRGVFITFEGGEGAGKTTHIRFLAETLEARGREVVRLREPGGTDIGEKLRAIVLDPGNAAMCDACELLTYEAARAQIVHQVVAPALARGAVVLCDRFFDSTMAYQGYGRGLDKDFVRRANEFACQGIRPDRTILLVPPSAEDGLIRATKRSGADRLEQAGVDFHKRVREAFASIAAEEPQRVRTVYSASCKSDTARAVFGELADLFPFFEDLLADGSQAHFLPLNKRHGDDGKATFAAPATAKGAAREADASPAKAATEAAAARAAAIDESAAAVRPSSERPGA